MRKDTIDGFIKDAVVEVLEVLVDVNELLQGLGNKVGEGLHGGLGYWQE